jgi:hypothetical protein
VKRTLILPALLAAAAGCGPPPVSGPLRQEAYVWQRDWNPAVRAAVARTGGPAGFAGLTLLAAQVDLRPSPPEVKTIAYDAEALRRSGLPVGLAIRIGAFPGRFADRPLAVDSLRRLAVHLLDGARAVGLAPAELQLDYDCPESKLEDYRALLEKLRPRVSPVPLTLTALPAWLDREGAFRNLIAAADGYVLQVHSLAPPPSPSADFVLSRPEEARGWAERAAGFGLPFRVALPTYSYVAAFDPSGRLLGLAAEGAAPLDRQDVRWRLVRSDPAAMASLVRGWTEARPAMLSGVVWYRLPVAGDRLNWSEPTLRAVRTGRPPRLELRAEPRTPEPSSPELVEIHLVNAGEADADRPGEVVLRWSGEPPLAADAVGGYRLQTWPGSARLLAPAQAVPTVLRPGESRVLAWLRFARPTEVRIEDIR